MITDEDVLAGFPIAHPHVPNTPEWIIKELETLVAYNLPHYDWRINELMRKVESALEAYDESLPN